MTFDDGPDPRFTPKVLDILKEKGVFATFFVVGQSVEKHPELLMRAWLDGHEIENHTYTHPQMKKLQWSDTVAEISKAQDVLMSFTGTKPAFFRPPRGEYNGEDVKAAKAMGYKIALWTVGLENHAAPTPVEMVERVVKNVQPGSVVLAHDGILDRSKSVTALPLLIDRLKSEGYTFVTLSELLVVTGRDKSNEDVLIFKKKWYEKAAELALSLTQKGPPPRSGKALQVVKLRF